MPQSRSGGAKNRTSISWVTHCRLSCTAAGSPQRCPHSAFSGHSQYRGCDMVLGWTQAWRKGMQFPPLSVGVTPACTRVLCGPNGKTKNQPKSSTLEPWPATWVRDPSARRPSQPTPGSPLNPQARRSTGAPVPASGPAHSTVRSQSPSQPAVSVFAQGVCSERALPVLES